MVSTCQSLCLLQQSYAGIADPPQFVSLGLKVDPVSNSEVQITTNNSILGTLENPLSLAIIPLLNFSLARMQALMLLPLVSSSERRKTPRAGTLRLDIVINIYGNQKHTTRIGRFLAQSKIFLQHPKFPEPGHLYKNPHFLSKPRALALITESTPTGGVTPIEVAKESSETEKQANTTELSKIFDGLWESEALSEHPGSWRLKTPLLRYN